MNVQDLSGKGWGDTNPGNQIKVLVPHNDHTGLDSLDPGKYTLKVMASFDGQAWPEKAQVMHLNVSPPWWGTWWFRT